MVLALVSSFMFLLFTCNETHSVTFFVKNNDQQCGGTAPGIFLYKLSISSVTADVLLQVNIK